MPGFWEKIFGPSREMIWRQLSEEINAQYVAADFWKGDKVEAQVGNWAITMDIHAVSTGKTVVQYTRLRAPYLNRDGFRFRIYRKGMLSDFGKKWLGVQDVEVGDPYFDETFIIQGNSTKQIRALFADERIRELIQAQPHMNLYIADDDGWFGKHYPEGVDEIYFEVAEVIKDVPRLRALFDLFSELLTRLHEIGSAYDHNPELPFAVPTEDTLLRPSVAPPTDPNMLLRPAEATPITSTPDQLLRPAEGEDHNESDNEPQFPSAGEA